MDDYTIHIQTRIIKVGDRNVAFVKERVWHPLVSYLTSLNNGIHMRRFVAEGLGISLITNMAIVAEGLIADIIDEHCLGSGITPDWGIGAVSSTWSRKKNKYNELFAKKLQVYRGYDAINVLFKFRDNVAHGLAHIEQSSTQEITNQKTDIKSKNNNYEIIRQFFVSRNYLQPTDTSSNTNQLWKYEHARYLWMETKYFLADVLKENESPHIEVIRNVWEMAISGRG